MPSFFVKVITETGKLQCLEKPWNAFISTCNNNPFLLHEFVTEFSKSNQSYTCNPLFAIGYDNEEIVGIAYLSIREIFGARIATFALAPYWSPDFVVKDQFRRKFMVCVLDLLFERLKCKVVDLTFPEETKSLRILEELCRTRRIKFKIEPGMEHRILRLEGDWEQFEKTLSGKSRKKFRQSERRLKQIYSFQISCVKAEEDTSITFDRISQIDKASWKEDWRIKKGQENDPDLMAIWEAAGRAEKDVPGFRCRAWILELNNQPVAFVIVIEYKNRAHIAKTSYIAQTCYERYSPGLLVINAALHALFDGKSVTEVEFSTDMPFMERWPTLLRGRKRVLIAKGSLSTRLISLFTNPTIRETLGRISSRITRSAHF